MDDWVKKARVCALRASQLANKILYVNFEEIIKQEYFNPYSGGVEVVPQPEAGSGAKRGRSDSEDPNSPSKKRRVESGAVEQVEMSDVAASGAGEQMEDEELLNRRPFWEKSDGAGEQGEMSDVAASGADEQVEISDVAASGAGEQGEMSDVAASGAGASYRSNSLKENVIRIHEQLKLKGYESAHTKAIQFIQGIKHSLQLPKDGYLIACANSEATKYIVESYQDSDKQATKDANMMAAVYVSDQAWRAAAAAAFLGVARADNSSGGQGEMSSSAAAGGGDVKGGNRRSRNKVQIRLRKKKQFRKRKSDA